jgi:hypothetical protein
MRSYLPSFRRRRGFAALLLLLLGVAVAPVLDGWVHAAEHGSTAQEGHGAECVLCRLDHAPAREGVAAAPGPFAERSVVVAVAPTPRVLPRSAAHSPSPPSRAPPL